MIGEWMMENWKCAKPCGKVMENNKEWSKHLREEHSDDKLCSGLAPLFAGYVICDKWEKHPGKHEALGYEWEDFDNCSICGGGNGANYDHWFKFHNIKKEEVVVDG